MNLEIHGFCDERFLPLKAAFAANFEEGLEVGASLAATDHGRPVVDLWAGNMDAGQGVPWQEDTIVEVASTTKIAAELSMLVLLDRGRIDLDERVAHYWPEFAQGGKDAVTVREAITHQAGVPGFDPPVSATVVCDWKAVTTRLAAEPHWFGGDRRICYHAMTYGFLIGELIRRVDGRSPRQFFYEEIAGRISLDFQLGLSSQSELARMAILSIPEGAFAEGGFAGRLLTSVDLTPVLNGEMDWTWLSREDPGGMGFGNGRSIARLCSIIANNGEIDDIRILSPGIIAEAGQEQAYGQCPYIGWLRLGLGFGLDSETFPAPSATGMHWGGYGGSWAFMDPAFGVSVGYAPNNWMLPEADEKRLGESDPRLRRIQDAVRTILTDL